MMPRTLSIPVAASLGKRKVQHLEGDCLPAEMSITIASSLGCQYLNVWIRDKHNRKFGLQIGNAQLKKLRDFLAGEERKSESDPKLDPEPDPEPELDQPLPYGVPT